MKIGPAIKLARENIRISAEVLADKINEPLARVEQIESGANVPPLQVLKKIAGALGLRISQLATIAESIHNPGNEIRMLQRNLLLTSQQILAR